MSEPLKRARLVLDILVTTDRNLEEFGWCLAHQLQSELNEDNDPDDPAAVVTCVEEEYV